MWSGFTGLGLARLVVLREAPSIDESSKEVGSESDLGLEALFPSPSRSALSGMG